MFNFVLMLAEMFLLMWYLIPVGYRLVSHRQSHYCDYLPMAQFLVGVGDV